MHINTKLHFELVCCLIQLQTSISINYNLDFNRHIQSKSVYSLKVLIATEEAIKHVWFLSPWKNKFFLHTLLRFGGNLFKPTVVYYTRTFCTHHAGIVTVSYGWMIDDPPSKAFKLATVRCTNRWFVYVTKIRLFPTVLNPSSFGSFILFARVSWFSTA